MFYNNSHLKVLRLGISILFLFGISSIVICQEETENNGEQIIEAEDFKDTWTAPLITDDMTIDEEQNKSWRMGDYRFSAKPRHSWEFGVHLGHLFIDGDVDWKAPVGWGVGLHLRRSLNYVLSLRGNLTYGVTSGLDTQPRSHRNVARGNGIGGSLVETTFDAYNPNSGGPGTWFPSFQTTYIAGDIMAILNIGNILFHKERNKWNIYIGAGLGMAQNKTMLDLFDESNQPYEGLVEALNWTKQEFESPGGKARYREELSMIYDGSYETEGFDSQDGATPRAIYFSPMVGLSRKINKRINIGIEHQVYITDEDYLDGIRFRTSVDLTNNPDIAHYTNLRIGINIGNFNKVTEPLYWLNPVDQAFNDLAIAKNNTQIDLVDEDNDGVIDIIDQELDTPEDCPVDTRGILLDSDGDGLADCEDQEPYSRPGCQIDEFGVAQCDDDRGSIDEGEVNALIDRRIEEYHQSYYPDPAFALGSSVRTRNGVNPDGSNYVLTLPLDDNGRYIATDKAKKEVTYADGSGYDVYLPVSSSGSFIPTDSAVKVVTREDGTQYSVVQPSDSRGNFVQSEEAVKIIQREDGTRESVVIPVDEEGQFMATENAKRVKLNSDGSGYVLLSPVDENGDFVATDSATKTVVNKDGSGYMLTLPIDENGDFVATNSALKTYVDDSGETKSFTVSVDDNGEIIESQEEGSNNQGGSIGTELKQPKLIDVDDYTRMTYGTAVSNNPVTQGGVGASPNSGSNSNTGSGNTDNNGGIADVNNSGNQSGSSASNSSSSNSGETKGGSSNTSGSGQPIVKTVQTVIHSGCGDWFLPMIHYDLNKSKIRPEYYSHLHNVAQVMKKCPNICVVAQGHTDTRSSNEYNRVLSYMRSKAAIDYLTSTYNIERSRLKLMYGGEENPMILNPSSEAHHFMNRRVEFKTCDSNDFDMAPPAGAEKLIQASKAKSEYYDGPKNSGY